MDHRVFLIGGTSHTGKSTLAESLATELRWDCKSTDKLARHPGRPWSTDGSPPPQHVIDHYSALSVEELVDSVLEHYEKNVLPRVEDILMRCSNSSTPGGLVLEGSALWPKYLKALDLNRVCGVWLTAPDHLIKDRIYENSRFSERDVDERNLITKFLDRSLSYNKVMESFLEKSDLPSIDVSSVSGIPELTELCLDLLKVGLQDQAIHPMPGPDRTGPPRAPHAPAHESAQVSSD